MKRFLPSLPALQAFEAAARLLNFTKAADELGMTQGGVSRHVQGLEQFLGMRLFERIGSNLVLSEIGSSYYEDVVQILARLEEASIDAVRGRRAGDALIIGSTPTLASAWLIPRMREFERRFPDIPFELMTVADTIDLETSPVDVAIMRGAGQWHGRAIKLFEEELAVVASPELLPIGETLSFLDFTQIPSLQNASRPSLWLTWLRVSGIPYSGTIQGNRFSHSALLLRAAIQGMGLAVIPRHYLTAELDDGLLHLPFGGPVRSGEAIWMVNAERKAQKRQLQVFRDWLRK
ncbi:LysR substrate-binding domain-containing protein [Paracoccus aerius]|uniref:LysR family transcriptional regulator n=1 Tax=Paracoccus aerius TaxID=1915382 RepID=A0ABS1S8F0_9RHOB|nr:LysR substrate-binding domain-containing protein [Paracoccus aerius]MBL3674819.1 LysR family transcriptional regulator [Paracoccus aerius]